MSIPKDAPEAEGIVEPIPGKLDLPGDDGSYQVAGLTDAITRRATRSITKGVMKPLTTPGARMSDEVEIVAPEGARIVDEPEVEVPQSTTEYTATPEAETDVAVKPIASEEAAEEAVRARAAGMDAPRTAPSPTAAQKEAGVAEGRVNTTFYDSDQLNATIQAVSADLPEVTTQSIQSIYDKASNLGIGKEVLDQIFKGKSMTSAVGGDQLSTRMAALITIHDASLVQIDNMMAKAASGNLGVAEKVRLREALAQHNIILEQLTTAKTDIARAMNVFKGAGDGTSKTLSMQQQQLVLDSFGGDDQLRVLAENWVKAPNTKAKNKLVQVGIFKKSIDAIIYTAQSSLLTDPNTHIFNAAGTTLLIAADTAERTAAVGAGLLKNAVRRMAGKSPAERFTALDITSRTNAIFNGILDGWAMMGDGFMQAQQRGARDVPRSSLSSEYFSNTPLMTLRGKTYTTGELKGTMIGRVLDGLSLVHSVPMRFIGAADGFFGGVSQRMELHEQAQAHGLRIYFDAIDADKTPEEAMRLAQEATGKLLSQQPADIAASTDGFRRMVTLQADIDRETPVSFLYTGANKILNWRGVKMITLFNKTMMNIANQGTARMPGFNLLSPQFYSDWKQGGKMRDLAVTRVGLGTAMLAGGYWLSETGRFTGAGPVDVQDRDTLTASGWMPFSLRLGEEEQFSPELLARLERVLGEGSVSKGTGDFTGQTFVSLKKLDPVTLPLLLGSSLQNSLHYSDYDDGELMQMVAAGTGATYQVASSFPQTQIVAELFRIMSSQYVGEDEGERMLRAFDQLVGTYSNTVISGTPIVGLANGALSARLERYIDPSMSETGIRADQVEWADDTLGIDATMPGFRAFGEAYNRLLSRTPFLSKTLPPRLNEWGEEIAPDLDTLYNFGPRMRGGMGKWDGKTGEVKMYLAEINHGITRLPKNLEFNGVVLNAEQRNRFIQLYANDIRPEQYGGMNMVEAIHADAKELIADVETLGIEFPFGEAQQRVTQIVSDYRAFARARMFGEFTVDEKYRSVNVSSRGVGSKLGLGGDRVEYPKESEKMRLEKSMRIFEPR